MRPKIDAVPMHAVLKDFYGKRVMFAAESREDLVDAYNRAFGPNAGPEPDDVFPVIVAKLEAEPESKPGVDGPIDTRAPWQVENVMLKRKAQLADEYLRQLGEANAHVTRLREELDAVEQSRKAGWVEAQRLAAECGKMAKEKDEVLAHAVKVREQLAVVEDLLKFGGGK